jgi:hypothetical protein
MAVFRWARDNLGMTTAPIFPFSRPSGFSILTALALLIFSAAGAALAAADPDADLKAKRPAHEQMIEKIESERLAFQRDLAQREEACLKRFFSASCMEEIRAEHLREMRTFDLRREKERQAIRDIEAELRARVRARRVAAP